MVAVIAEILTAIVAIEHLYILWIEMFAWETAGKKTFKTIPEEIFKQTKGLAANQGLYNGFLSAGLIWSFLISDINWIVNIRLFFLGCVIVAGIYGAITASRKIFIIQALPAIIALIFVLIASQRIATQSHTGHSCDRLGAIIKTQKDTIDQLNERFKNY